MPGHRIPGLSLYVIKQLVLYTYLTPFEPRNNVFDGLTIKASKNSKIGVAISKIITDYPIVLQ